MMLWIETTWFKDQNGAFGRKHAKCRTWKAREKSQKGFLTMSRRFNACEESGQRKEWNARRKEMCNGLGIDIAAQG